MGKGDSRRFKCKLCGKRFMRNDKLNEHMVSHTGEKAHKCDICQKSFGLKGNLVRHRRHHSRAHINYQCKICFKWLTQESGPTHLLKHDRDNESKCGICHKQLSSPIILSRHMGVHVERKCPACRKSFASKQAYTFHMKNVQTRKKLYKCYTCETSFICRPNLRRHMKSHSNDIQFKCSKCDKSFQSLITLRRHFENIHEKLKLFSCLMCNEETQFYRSGNLNQHLRHHIKERPCFCGLCGKEFENSSSRNVHIRLHIDERPYKCQDCGKTFSSHASLRNHVSNLKSSFRLNVDKTTGKPFKCDRCSRRFSTLSGRTYHTKFCNRATLVFPCTKCSKTFKSLAKLNEHDKRLHQKLKLFSCLMCNDGKQFFKIADLQSHLRNHTRESPYICQLCDKEFMNPYTLHVHLRTHTGERPYKCEQCAQSFVQVTSYKIHLSRCQQARDI